MSDQNPYSTPEASLDVTEAEFYQPSLFSFNGRIGRLRYLAYGIGVNLLLMLVMMPIMGGMMAAGGNAESLSAIGVLAMAVFYIAAIVFSIMFGKRRLNDLDKSGWWILLFLIPVLNLLIMIYLIFFSGTDGANNYGPMPAANSLGVKILGSILPVVFILGIVAAIAIPAYQDFVVKAQQSQMQQ